MTYGTLAIDTIQSSTTGTPTQFNDGSGTQIGQLARAWVSFTGANPAVIRASFNVSSITYNSTGNYNANFTNALTDANYTVAANIACQGYGLGIVQLSGRTASTVNVTSLQNSGSAGDAAIVELVIHR